MNLFRKLFNSNPSNEPEERIRITEMNLLQWPKFHSLYEQGKIKFDAEGQLRYLHGAPVGDLILVRVNKDGTPKYKESAQEWFDPDSPKAKEFNGLIERTELIMNFEEFRTQLENELRTLVKFELQEFIFQPHAFGNGLLGYRINGLCYRLTYDGRERQLRVDSSEPHEKYFGATWSELRTFDELSANISGIAELLSD